MSDRKEMFIPQEIIFLSILAIFLSGCFGPLTTYKTQVQYQANYDLNCPVKKIKIKKIENKTFLAEGCGKSVMYECSKDFDLLMGQDPTCRVVKDTK